VEYGISGEVSRSVHGHPTGRKTNYYFFFSFEKEENQLGKSNKSEKREK
jgi:hypothetical protein